LKLSHSPQTPPSKLFSKHFHASLPSFFYIISITIACQHCKCISYRSQPFSVQQSGIEHYTIALKRSAQ
jgi:hypothetical protein